MGYAHPSGHVFYRRPRHPRPMIDHGEGAYLYDTDDRRYLDASGGAVVCNLGHGVGEVVQAMAEQARQVGYVHATMFTSQAQETYAGALAEVLPLPDARFFFLSSGSEAVETALKLSRQVQIERGQPGRFKIASRWGSYHGTTLGALAVTGKPKLRRPYQPMLPGIEAHIPPPYCYRCPYGLEVPECGLRCAEALGEQIKHLGEQNVAAFIAEPISGATLGAVVPPQGYWRRIRQICDQYGMLLIADEVMTGFGRTGRWFAFQHWEAVPDIVTLAKGAAGGYFPLSITAARGEWVEAIIKGSGEFVHGGTFSHHAVGVATGLATLRYLQRHDLIAQAAQKGESLGQKLHAALGESPVVGDIRGIGLMWGVEFVADWNTKAPFAPEDHFAQRVADAAFQRGLIVYPGSGCADGEAGDLVMVCPPFVISDEQIDEAVGLLSEAIDAAAQEVSAGS
jgi:adenosylmethionine-8-amino-7-oxononanoate aminotransferase